MAMRMFAALLLGLTAACVTARVEPSSPQAAGGIGDVIEVADGLMVKPLSVSEDSRCPQRTQCVWAGRLVLQARIIELDRDRAAVLVLGQPERVSGGTLTLTDAVPVPVAGAKTDAATYRFSFAFSPAG